MAVNIIQPSVELFNSEFNTLDDSRRNILEVTKVCRMIDSYKGNESKFLKSLYDKKEWGCLEHSDFLFWNGSYEIDEETRFYDLRDRIWIGDIFEDDDFVISGNLRDFIDFYYYIQCKKNVSLYVLEYIKKIWNIIHYITNYDVAKFNVSCLQTEGENLLNYNSNEFTKCYIKNKRLTFKIVASKGCAIVQTLRYRMLSPMQESTRYVNYSKNMNAVYLEDEMPNNEVYNTYYERLLQKQLEYKCDLNNGINKETARKNLPLNISATLYATGRIKDWEHFIEERTTSHAEPEIKFLALKIKQIIDGVLKYYE